MLCGELENSSSKFLMYNVFEGTCAIRFNGPMFVSNIWCWDGDVISVHIVFICGTTVFGGVQQIYGVDIKWF
jgi:hypothetical protein